ncbi:hypothetical protein EK904_007697 [Melospiza melodia maxima]|nr:hypothetical protein EK904_007697 [Melospiza melodia maxima]
MLYKYIEAVIALQHAESPNRCYKARRISCVQHLHQNRHGATLGLPLPVSPCPCVSASLQAEQGPAHFGHRAAP